MTGKFSSYLKSKKKIIKQMIDDLGLRYPYISVLGTDVSGQIIATDKSVTTVAPSGITESGFVIKVFNGVSYSELSVNDINTKNYQTIINDIHSLTSLETAIPTVKVDVLAEEPLTKRFKRLNKGSNYTTEQIIGILKDYVNRTLSESSLVVNARAMIENTEVSKMFMSKNKDLEQYYTWSNPRSFVLVRRDNNTKYSYDGFGTNSIEEALNGLSPIMDSTLKVAIELLDSTPPVPGFYDVITDPSITGLIAHEAFGHGVEMDMFVKDRAKSVEYMNKQVASPLITMHDGASATFSVASYFFDDDGVIAQDTTIIKNGILVSGISDALSALQLGKKPTGNGRRESYKRKSYTRMTNTFFSSGNSSLEEMIKSVEYGYLLAQTNNGMEDPKNWGIQCTAHYGREIKNGAFTGKIVSPVVMSGYVIDLLNSITAVSKDFEVVGSGSCGKGYKEWVRVSDGGAYLKAKVKIG